MEVVIPIMFEESVAGYVPPQERKRLETELIPFLSALSIQTIQLGFSIRKCSIPCKSKIVLVLLRRNKEEVAKIRGPKEIPPKSSDRI